MKTGTETVTLSLTGDTANMLRAFTRARNGSMHNQADAAIREGIYVMLGQSPAIFQQRYAEAYVGLTAAEGDDND